MATKPATLAQTIQVINKSGKVVNTSKSFKEVFDEAKSAYIKRKTEIKAERKRQQEDEERKAIAAVAAMRLEDEKEHGRTSSKRSSKHRTRDGDRLTRISDDLSRDNERSSAPRFLRSLDGPATLNRSLSRSPSHTSLTSPSAEMPTNQLLRRAQTDQQLAVPSRHNGTSEIGRPLQRSYSASDIDLDLAYGEFHDPDLRPVPKEQQEKELKTLVERCQGLLVEADCATASAKAIFKHLQDHPDVMANVALTLADISKMAAKVGPGALSVFKVSAPGVVALLAAPEFLIAVGVGVGLTIVMFGGYKIVKKISARRNASDEHLPISMGASKSHFGFRKHGAKASEPVDEMMDVQELDHIERWRRGVVDVRELEPPSGRRRTGDDGRSVFSGYSETSVEGEFITPYALQSMGHLPLPPKSERSKRSHRDKDSKQSRRHRDEGGDTVSSAGSDATNTSKGSKRREKNTIKVKKPSPLRRMFASGTSTKS